MPLGEPELYKVLCDAKAGGASLSELRGIMEAVTFVRFTFDVDQFSSCAKSRRCWGLSSAKRAQLVTRADPMRVVDILELHRILDQGDDLWDRLMCGAALCCIYCRGRWNDVQHVDNWTLELNDDGHVEFASAVIDIHKTMFFASKAPKVMELIAPGAGVAEGCWVSAFLQVRELLGATYKEVCQAVCILKYIQHIKQNCLLAESRIFQGYEMTKLTRTHSDNTLFFQSGAEAPEVRGTKTQPAHAAGEPHRPPPKGLSKTEWTRNIGLGGRDEKFEVAKPATPS